VNYRFIAFYIFCIIFNLPGFGLPRKSWKDSFKLAGLREDNIVCIRGKVYAFCHVKIYIFSVIVKMLAYLQVDELIIQGHLLVIQNKKCENSLTL